MSEQEKCQRCWRIKRDPLGRWGDCIGDNYCRILELERLLATERAAREQAEAACVEYEQERIKAITAINLGNFDVARYWLSAPQDGPARPGQSTIDELASLRKREKELEAALLTLADEANDIPFVDLERSLKTAITASYKLLDAQAAEGKP